MNYYFAYGSNIDAKQMSTRCPDARFVSVGCLKEFDFLINERGVASVIPQVGSLVYGVVWEVSTQDTESLDQYEGIRQGIYSKQHNLPIKTEFGEISGFVYIANNQFSGKPRPRYLEKIIDNAGVLGFDFKYVQRLKTWIPE